MSIVKSEMLEYGFHKLILKVDAHGHLCGYLGVPCEHPFYKLNYMQCVLGCEGRDISMNEVSKNLAEAAGHDVYQVPEEHNRHFLTWDCIYNTDNHQTPEGLINCHGGITFSGIPYEGEKPDLWYFGFDCAHYMDYSPGLAKISQGFEQNEAEYRDEQYVDNEINSMFEQVKAYVLVKDIK